MRKVLLLLALIVIFASFSYAQEGEETPTVNRLIITYESFGQGQETEINLKHLFGKDADFVAGPTEHVDVKINFLTKVATLNAKDPSWKGKEKIVFVTDPIYLKAVEKLEEIKEVKVDEEGKIEEKKERNLTYVVVSEEQVLDALDELVKESFEFMLPGIEPREVDVSVEREGDAVIIDLSEASINVSFAQGIQKPAITMDMGYNTSGLRAPEFAPRSYETIYLALVAIVAAALVLLYARFGGAAEALVFRRKAVPHAARIKGEKAEAKSAFLSTLRGFEKKQGSPVNLYKELSKATSKFLADYYMVRLPTPRSIMGAVSKEEKDNKQLIEAVREYFSRASLPYSSGEVSHKELKEFISAVKRLSKSI